MIVALFCFLDCLQGNNNRFRTVYGPNETGQSKGHDCEAKAEIGT
jgi:hypothetical protein